MDSLLYGGPLVNFEEHTVSYADWLIHIPLCRFFYSLHYEFAIAFVAINLSEV